MFIAYDLPAGLYSGSNTNDCCPTPEKVFSDKIPMCTEQDCAKKPSSDGDHYSGVVKPGNLVTSYCYQPH